MNFTNITIEQLGNNLSNRINDIPAKCMLSKNSYSLDCLYNSICPQFNHYFIKIGLIIIISYIIISWFLWWFLNYGYKKLKNKKMQYIGNLDILETRIYWDTFIRAKITKVMLGYIAIVVYLSLKK